MSKLVEALRESLKWDQGKSGKHALEHIETGDPGPLGKIRPVDPNQAWLSAIDRALPPPDALGEEDLRGLHALTAARAFYSLGRWFDEAVAREEEGQDFQGIVAAEMSATKAPKAFIDTVTVAMCRHFARDGRANSSGRYVLTLSDEETVAALLSILNTTGKGSTIIASFTELVEFLIDQAPDRVEPLFPVLLHKEYLSTDVCEALLKKGGGRFDQAVAAAWREIDRDSTKLDLTKILYRHSPERFGTETLDLARAMLFNRRYPSDHHDAAVWALETFGEAMIDDVVAGLDAEPVPEQKWDAYRRRGRMSVAVKLFGAKALPVVLAAPAKISDADTLYESLTHLIRFADPALDEHILAGLRRGIDDAEKIRTPFHGQDLNGPVISFINLAARWNPSSVEDRLWEHLGHKLKDVRSAAARALGKIGPGVVPRAAALLGDPKPENRASAITVLATSRTPEGLAALEGRLDVEADEDLRDAILEIVDGARVAAGREVTPEEIEARIGRQAAKLKAPPAKWLDESRLPPLSDSEGKSIGPEATRYLFYRQARAKEMRPDVEARPLYGRIDRSTGGDFALELLRQFAASKAEAKDRWALAIAGLLGDDRIVPVLAPMIQCWGDSSRFKMAELAVHALALVGTEAAMLGVDATAIRYRTKNKSVGAAAREAFAEAAERLGVTLDELGDLVVPRLGFEPGRPRVVGPEGKQIEVTIGPDFKLKYRDLEKKKSIASPPKSLPKETLAELKEAAASLREVAKVQKARLENLMVRQFRWPARRWAELFLGHPVLFLPFATRLIWGHHDDSGARLAMFRALEDRTLTGPADEPVAIPESGTVGIVHPLELGAAELAAWRAHVTDYEVEPPFLQLDRPVVRVEGERTSMTLGDDVSDVSLNVMTFRNRADKLGWVRGPVMDAGGVDVYWKSFPSAGLDAFLETSGLYMGIAPDATIDLGRYYFLREGTVRGGHYVMDMPDREERSRRIPFGELPPLVYSEVAGDVRRIAGQATTAGGEEPEEE